jgi:hypothetical protein
MFFFKYILQANVFSLLGTYIQILPNHLIILNWLQSYIVDAVCYYGDCKERVTCSLGPVDPRIC